MSDARWYPFTIRRDGKQEGYDTLVDGVPPWLTQALLDWLDENYIIWTDGSGYKRPNRHVLRAVELKLRVQLDWTAGDFGGAEALRQACRKDADLFLSLVDLAINDLVRRQLGFKAIAELEVMLATAGSAWMVAPNGRSLVARVQPAMVEAAQQIIQSGSRAGDYLAEAWRQTYSRNPNPSAGYREAVRAVEVAVCPVIIPKDQKPTLGKAITALRDAPPGKFLTVFEGNMGSVEPLDAVRGLMGLVWTNQLDRHGVAEDQVPIHVSSDQAEAALYAAVTLVQWFQRGYIRRGAP